MSKLTRVVRPLVLAALPMIGLLMNAAPAKAGYVVVRPVRVFAPYRPAVVVRPALVFRPPVIVRPYRRVYFP